MEPFRGKIGIVGAGALGGYYGARLCRAGADVHFLMRGDYDAVRARGLRVDSVEGDFVVQAPVYRTAAEMGRCDLVIVGLKTTDNGTLASLLPGCAGPDTVVLTLQNGLGNEESIEQVLGPGSRDRIVGGTAFLCSVRPEPGVIRHTAHGWVRLAEYGGASRERTHALAALFEAAGITCEVHESLLSIRWHKLVWNIAFNGLGVAAGHATTEDVLEDDELRASAVALMEEVRDAARADDVEIEAAFVDRMMDATTGMEKYRTSMQIDYEEGRPLEVESILGEPVRRARRAGIAVPRMELVYGLVRRLDRERRRR